MGTMNFTIDKGVARFELNRPDALNALDFELLAEFDEALAATEADPTVKAAVVSGAGRAFCTGADLKTVMRLLDEWPDYVRYLYRLTAVFRRLETLPIPTIARVHGYALAGGLELVLCCDMAIAADDAQIGDQHANVGLIAGAGGIPRLIRRIGKQSALELLYTGGRLNGPEAAQRGIVLRSVPAEELDSAISGLTDLLVQKSKLGMGYTKRVALAGEDVPLVTALNEERAALLEYFGSSSHPREGINAFLEKRSPNFDV
ncbi:MAG TPA: enoyl-CoA hydratase/isomerase family protein [Pseudonocardiaceae bacterium]|jgi:enoyl-CoA hydratase/carnithine racemase